MKTLRTVAFIALFLALFVVMLGAYTRLTDAGLGCPDWPGCYGKLVLPSAKAALADAQQTYPDVPIESGKAWTEMAHRYAAGTLVLLLGFIIFKTLRSRKLNLNIPWQLPLSLSLLIAFQALLGMWTVTFKLLPIVVMSHLLGGILIFTCTSYFCWQFSNINGFNLPKYRKWLNLGLIIVFLQIALGGLVSANYAGIACFGFPKCSGMWLPKLDFSNAFNLFPGVGANYQGGLLDNASRMTLQFVHRIGAIVTLVYILITAGWVFATSKFRTLKVMSGLTGLLVLLQFALGIVNVVHLLPLSVAVLHNGCAALLLASVASLRYLVSSGGSNGK